MYSSNSARNLRMIVFTGQPAPSARPQIVVPGMMPMRSATSIEDVQIFQPALAAADAVDDLEHPAGALAARRTLAARLVGEEPADVVQHIDDAGLLVEDRDGRGAQAEAADLAGAVEIERHVELGFSVMKPMLRPPGMPALALRPFQTPPPCFSTSSRTVTPSGNSTQPGLLTWPLMQ